MPRVRRRFGVEIEFVGDLGMAIAALNAAELQVIDSSHTHDTGVAPRDWTVKRDGSVRGGGELVSPPLDFDNPDHREQVNTAIEALQAADCAVHETAGIHVHVDCRDLDPKQVTAVVRFCYKFEDAIYRIASSGWLRIRFAARTYAKPVSESTVRALMRARTMNDVQRIWNGQDFAGMILRGQDRYTAVNLVSFFFRGTIEFRYFNTSLNPERVQAYIALCMAIVDDARAGHCRSVKKSYPLGSMYAGQVDPYLLRVRLQQVLRSNARDTHVVMEEEDWKRLLKVWNDSVPQENFTAREERGWQ